MTLDLEGSIIWSLEVCVFSNMLLLKVMKEGVSRHFLPTFFFTILTHLGPLFTRMQNIFSYGFDFAEIFARERSPTLIKKNYVLYILFSTIRRQSHKNCCPCFYEPSNAWSTFLSPNFVKFGYVICTRKLNTLYFAENF